jgi:hypothetical protein
MVTSFQVRATANASRLPLDSEDPQFVFSATLVVPSVPPSGGSIGDKPVAGLLM